ncbi:MAG: hypothetical protein E7473_04010 [Ruminococcaceae bacterium]|nr:hypothetical protein [Oscillospiraceae bacterium]
MDFKNIPSICHPAYIWQWNSHITKEGIKRQIDEMYDCGIRAFYILGEPSNFRPTKRRTHLSPEYLSDEYLELVYYAYKMAKEKEMYTWLYNEGGFPSGMACGKIREKYPHLAMKNLVRCESDSGDVEYAPRDCCDDYTRIRTDIAKRETTDEFIKLTHEAYKRVFGDALGGDVTLMFDDESNMGSWTDGLDEMFEEKYGYSLQPYFALVAGDKNPEKEDEYRAMSDYIMLCGDLVRNNYFIPMKEWLNKNNMLSTGHLDLDNQTEGCRIMRYGNVMATLRAFDAPGVDVIWSQIDYPENGVSCPDGMDFWVRCASAAARQQGKTLCTSETFAVFGSHVTPELMRYIINFQAIRGINRFNFGVLSYDRESILCNQYRPNFIKENPGMDMLSEINDYTARLSYILEKGKSEVNSALYYPCRTICAGGKVGSSAARAFEDMGHYLEKMGVVFDIIDEDFAEKAEWKDGMLCNEYVSYKNIFVPEAPLEKEEIMKKLSVADCDILPCVVRENLCLQARKLVFDDSVMYLVCNTSGDGISEQISFEGEGYVYKLDLYSGEYLETDYTKENGIITTETKLLRGEIEVFCILKAPIEAKKQTVLEKISDITEIKAKKVREFSFGDKGIVNVYIEEETATPWNIDFSGEAEYTFILPDIGEASDIVLDMGEVRFFARVYVNGKAVAEKTMPHYRVKLCNVKEGDEVKVLVANTSSNVCAITDYFDRQDISDVGPYNEKMLEYEKKCTVAGGLLGPICLFTEKEQN